MIFQKTQAGRVLSLQGRWRLEPSPLPEFPPLRERRPLQAAAGMHRSSRRSVAPALGLRGLSPGARDSGAMHSGHSRLI